MGVTRITRAILLLLAAGAVGPLFADDGGAAAWLSTEPRAQAYAGDRERISSVMEEASRAGAPADLLVAKLKEGVSKRVPAAVLLDALRAEAARLSLAARLVSNNETVVDPADGEKAVRRIGLLLAGGVSVDSVQAILDAASRTRRGSAAVVEALGVLAQVTLSMQLPDPLVQRLGTSLLKSRMQPEVFASVLPVLLRARAVGVSPEAAISMVTRVLDSGGGVIQMQDQIEASSPAAQGKAGAGGSANGLGNSGGTRGSGGGNGNGNGGNGPGPGGSPGGGQPGGAPPGRK